MFGDKTLFGHYELNVKKGRCFLPTNTCRQENDVLALVYDSDLDIHRLYNFNTLEHLFKHYEELMYNASTKEEELLYKKKYFEFAKSIIQECVVDAEGRIVFKGTFEKEGKLEAIGSGDHLILIPKAKPLNK